MEVRHVTPTAASRSNSTGSGSRPSVSIARVRIGLNPVLLDPSLPASGDVDRGWGVRLNVERAEIADAGQT